MTTTTNKEPTVTTNTMPEEKDLTPATYHHHDNPEEGDGQEGNHHHEQNCKEDHGGAVRQEDVEDLEGVGEDWPEETTNTMGEQRRQPKMQEVGDTSCVDSMHSRMPTPYVWASQGGITPKESVVNLVLTPILLPDHMPSAQGDQDAPGPDHQPVDEEGHHQEHQQDEPVPGEEPVSCEISMQERLPTPKVWASPGGSCPRTPSNLSSTNTVTLEETAKEYQDPDDLAHHGDHHAQEDVQGEQGEKEGEAWIQGAGDEENERYKSVLEYCEKRRIELRAKIEEDEERMKEARRKEDTWMLLRESITFLKSKEVIWRTRRLEECSRIREEEKRDRLAVVAVKKRKYGVKRMTKEENSRIKERTEERLEIATAKTNYCRNYRERKDDM